MTDKTDGNSFEKRVSSETNKEILKDVEEYCTTVDYDIGNKRALGVFKDVWNNYYQQAVLKALDKARAQGVAQERTHVRALVEKIADSPSGTSVRRFRDKLLAALADDDKKD